MKRALFLVGVIFTFSVSIQSFAISDGQLLQVVTENTNNARIRLSYKRHHFNTFDEYVYYSNETIAVLSRAFLASLDMRDAYHLAVANLIIADASATDQPWVPIAYKKEGEMYRYYFPYNGVAAYLDKALDATTRFNYRDNSALMAEIHFLVALHYDKLRRSVLFMNNEDLKFAKAQSHPPWRDFYTRAKQAIEQAQAMEKESFASSRSSSRPSFKGALYERVEHHFKSHPMTSKNPALIDLPPRWRNSLAAHSVIAQRASRIPLSERKEFKLLDFVFDLVVPHYGLFKKTIGLIRSL